MTDRIAYDLMMFQKEMKQKGIKRFTVKELSGKMKVNKGIVQRLKFNGLIKKIDRKNDVCVWELK